MESHDSSLSHPALKLLFGDCEDSDSYISSPHSFVEMNLSKLGRTMDNKDEEISAMFDWDLIYLMMNIFLHLIQKIMMGKMMILFMMLRGPSLVCETVTLSL